MVQEICEWEGLSKCKKFGGYKSMDRHGVVSVGCGGIAWLHLEGLREFEQKSLQRCRRAEMQRGSFPVPLPPRGGHAYLGVPKRYSTGVRSLCVVHHPGEVV
jgi:hypothetical protein